MLHREHFTGPALELFAAAESAAAQIPPAWPLSATVAVNPFLGQTGEPLEITAARLSRSAGVRVTPDRSHFAAKRKAGEITDANLRTALGHRADAGLTLADLDAALDQPSATEVPLPTVAGLAAQASGIDWPDIVADRIGHWAAGHFDAGQALWPALDAPAWTAWRAYASRDLTPEIAGLTGFATRIAACPASPRAALLHAIEALGVPQSAAAQVFERQLASLGGWGQYARGLDWTAARDGERRAVVTDLLTIRLAWDTALLDRYRDRIAADWATAVDAFATPLSPTRDQLIDVIWQEAAEIASQDRLRECLASSGGTPATETTVQAAFCIDVRSEILRRALETVDPGIRTIGFAGFFGLPVRHTAAASDVPEARGPVLLTPALETRAGLAPEPEAVLRLRRRAARAWGRFKLAAVSSFAFVEAAGLGYAAKLLCDAFGPALDKTAEPAPVLNATLEERIGAAAQVLRAMSLTEGFARLVLIAGHGAHVANTPFASALQCGACGGHAGDVNARLLAGLLNDPAVRAGLVNHGITIPKTTYFLAGLHDTVTDEVRLFEDGLANGHMEDVARLRAALTVAAGIARTERAARLPRAGEANALMWRGRDWAEVRPEWGLAGCAAFIAAPRTRTAGKGLEGRAFLHSYDWEQDKGFATLELILTAPVVVASWISLQYYGAAVAPDAFGAGNKLIHNVTGGIGVVEGNGGALRTGLPWQSVHDGDRLMHDPLRLTVAIEAPRAAITAVLDRHGDVRALFQNGWLSLFAMDADGRLAWRYTATGWEPAQTHLPERIAA